MRKPKGKRPIVRYKSIFEDNIKRFLKKWDGEMWNGFIWLRIRISGGLL
jgi:hypothetical protein